MAICHCCVQKIRNHIKFWFSEFDKMKQKSEGIGLVVGRVQRIEEEAANASLKVTMMTVMMKMMIMRIFDMTKMVMKIVMIDEVMK